MNNIFDSHMHLNINNSTPLQSLLGSMKVNKISKGMLIFNTIQEIKSFYIEIMETGGRDYLSKMAYSINYMLTEEEMVKDLTKKGFKFFIKVHPRISNLTKNNFTEIISYIYKSDGNVIIIDMFPYGHHIENHIGLELIVCLAQIFPEKKFVMAHSGGYKLLECMLLTRTLKNVYYDLSLSCNYLFGTSVHSDMVQLIRFNYERVMFGSDFPDFSQKDAICKMMILCEEAELSEEKINMIFYNNAQNLYAIE